jgi:enamine deaminase RidA (YjgF/YER057c/UK114 family)
VATGRYWQNLRSGNMEHFMIKRIKVEKRYSDVAIFNGVAWLAGQVPRPDAGEDIRSQMRDVLAQIDELLDTAGSDKSRILSTQIFLADLADKPGMDEIWDAWVVDGHAPPRATVQARLARPFYKVEVVMTAALKEA